MAVSSVGRASSASAPVLVGRQREVERISDFFVNASQRGGTLLVLGEPGVGKSALLGAAAEEVLAHGGLVVAAAGLEHEGEITFSLLSLLMHPLHDRFTHLEPRERQCLSTVLGLSDGPPPARLAVANAVLALLRIVAEDRPLLVAVDDLQWVDRSSAVILGLVARRLAGTKVALLAASRSGETSFFESLGIPELRLEALDTDASTRLVAAEFPSLAPRVRHRVLVEAEGNPLALLELPAALSIPERLASQGVPAVLPLGQKLQTTFAGRLTRLPPATRSLLLLAALDSIGDLSTLQQASGATEGLDALGPAEQSHLVRVDDVVGRVVFRHPLVRAAVVAASTSSERRSAHRALAGELIDQPERRVWHLAAACVEPDQTVSRLLEENAWRVLHRGDAVGAVTALIRAADLAPSRDRRSSLIAQAAYVGAEVTGDLRNVARLLADARRANPAHGESLEAAAAAGYALLNGEGDLGTAHRLLVGALDAGKQSHAATPTSTGAADVEPGLLGALDALLSLCCWGERAALWPPLLHAIDVRREILPRSLHLRVQVLGDPAHLDAATLAEFDETVAVLHEQADSSQTLQIAMAGSHIDRIDDCRAALWRVIEDGREGGAVTSAINAMMALCIEDVAVGEWDEALELADEGLRLCDAHGYGLRSWLFRNGQALVAAGRGDHDTVDRLADQMTGWAAPRGVGTVLMHARRARGLAASGRGDFEEAYAQLSAISQPGEFPPFAPYALKIPLDLVEAAVRTDRNTDAEAHVEAMRGAGLSKISVHLAVMTTASAALCAHGDEATELFEEAVSLTDASRWPFDLARVHLAYGEHLRRNHAAVAARGHISAALDVFERLGARPWVDRGTAELRATGQTRHHNEHAGLEPLTPQEREIALFAASGLSNKQIAVRVHLSHRTVATHLYRAFPKLGITSRAALRDALAGQDLDTDPLSP
jgi:DNA-binding CsgD family transcriptional regulator